MSYAYHAPDKIDEAIPLDPEESLAPLTPQGLVKAWGESGTTLEGT